MSNHNSKPEPEETPEQRLNRQINSANQTISYQEAEINKKKQKVNELEKANKNLIEEYERIQYISYRTEKENRRLIDEKENLRRQLKQNNIALQKEREKKKNEDDIKKFGSSQDIATFLELVERFYNNLDLLGLTIDELKESIIVKKYEEFKKQIEGKIQVIESNIYGDTFLENHRLKKLIILLLCYEKNKNNCDKVLKKLVEKGSNKKELIFDILLDYGNEFGKDILFEDDIIYEEFANYSLNHRKYLKSLNYRSNDIIQLKFLYENRDIIFKNIKKIEFIKLNSYDEAYELIEKIIKFQKEKQ